MRNIALRLRYDGSAYHGWQRQAGLPTVQQTVEDAIAKILGTSVHVTGCGRTDAGVHALRYCANFRSDCTIPIEKVPLALNARLPGDIAVTDACEVDESFNAIGSCIQKEYIYKILNSRIPDPFLDKRVYFYPSRLDIAQMRAAAKAFEGTHDFAAVRSVGTETKTTVRTVYWCDAEREGDLITVRVCANALRSLWLLGTCPTIPLALIGNIQDSDNSNVGVLCRHDGIRKLRKAPGGGHSRASRNARPPSHRPDDAAAGSLYAPHLVRRPRRGNDGRHLSAIDA